MASARLPRHDPIIIIIIIIIMIMMITMIITMITTIITTIIMIVIIMIMIMMIVMIVILIMIIIVVIIMMIHVSVALLVRLCFLGKGGRMRMREGGREGYGRPRERTEPSGFDAICMVLGDLHGVLHVFR